MSRSMREQSFGVCQSEIHPPAGMADRFGEITAQNYIPPPEYYRGPEREVSCIAT